MITVRCGSCGETFPEDAVEIDDIEEGLDITGISEGLRGEDIVEFKCPACGEDSTGVRRGR